MVGKWQKVPEERIFRAIWASSGQEGTLGAVCGSNLLAAQRRAGQQSRAMRLATVSATTPNMRWHMTLAAPRTRTQRPP